MTHTDTTVAILCAPEGTEQIELTSPREALDRHARTHLLSTSPGRIQAFDHLDRADTFPVDGVVGEASVDDYDALLLPGGVANPDMLRTDPQAVAFVRAFFDEGKPVAAICHAPWTLIEADVVRDRQLTSWPSLQTDLRNAGARWVDETVVVCSGQPSTLVTSRNPDDLPAFNDAIVEHLLTQPATR